MAKTATPRALALAALLAAATTAQAQHSIGVTIDNCRECEIYLAHYHGDKTFVDDTLRLDDKGRGVFAGPDKLKEGLYLVVLPERNYFEIIVDDQQDFSVATVSRSDIREMIESMTVRGSASNALFREYQIYMHKATAKAHKLKVEAADKSLSERRRAEAARQLSKESEKILTRQAEIRRQHPNTLLAKIIASGDDPKMPDTRDSVARYNFFKDHFFDCVDFGDPRLLYTPLYANRLARFYDHVVSPAADSVVNATQRLLEAMGDSSAYFQFTLQYAFNKFAQSKIMGHDKVTVRLADRYYLSGRAPWADSAFLDRLRLRVEKMRPNVLGASAPRLDKAQTPEGHFYPLHDTRARYLAVVFWEPSCGHCKKEIPQLLRLYDEYKDRGFGVYAFYTQHDTDEWRKFIDDYGMGEWVNVYDPFNFTQFRDLYDVYSTPTLYLLDSEHRIVAKRVTLESVEEYLKTHLTE